MNNKIPKKYIIAEIGVNHEGSLELAKKLIKLAKSGGANAAKFQSYKAELIASKNSPYYWDITKEKTDSQYKLFKKYDNFGKNDYIELAKYCRKIGIDFLSTPFDDNAVDFLDPLVPFFKIASADITNFPLLKKIALKNKPIILSTGASDIKEIKASLEYIKNFSKNEIVLMHCILNYPTNNRDANLLMINHLKNEFKGYRVGYSDHTLPDFNMSVCSTAYSLGATIIEKHFTFDKKLPGNDHYHAMDEDDLKTLVANLKHIDLILGKSKVKKPLKSEEIAIKNARRSLVLKNKLLKNQIITEKDLIPKRPGTGISPAMVDNIIGRRVRRNLNSDHILLWSDLLN